MNGMYLFACKTDQVDRLQLDKTSLWHTHPPDGTGSLGSVLQDKENNEKQYNTQN